MVVVPEAPIITMDRPIVNAQANALNHFGSLGHSPSYNVHSIPMASSPFSYGMPNFNLQFSNSIPAVGPNASIGLGGSTPPYTPFSFGGSQNFAHGIIFHGFSQKKIHYSKNYSPKFYRIKLF
jgi:hypothetical protein